MTSNVDSPPFLPNSMSVFSLSPTMIVRLGSKSCLCGFPAKIDNNDHHELLHAVAGDRAEGGTYFALMHSSIVAAGLPMYRGSFPIAVLTGAMIAPAPGSRPCAEG